MTGLYLLDTNIISEQWAKRPNPDVMAWLDRLGLSSAYLSVMTIGEIRTGINRMEFCKKRTMLEAWLADELPVQYQGRILPVDMRIANHWGTMMAEYRHNDILDMIIAATAALHDMTMVTRNERHFGIAGLRVVNPWKTR